MHGKSVRRCGTWLYVLPKNSCIKRNQLVYLAFVVAALEHRFAARASHLFGPKGILQQVFDRIGKRWRVAGRNQEAEFSIAEKGADRWQIAADHRKAAGPG